MEEEIVCNRWKDLAGDEWKEKARSWLPALQAMTRFMHMRSLLRYHFLRVAQEGFKLTSKKDKLKPGDSLICVLETPVTVCDTDGFWVFFFLVCVTQCDGWPLQRRFEDVLRGELVPKLVRK